MVVYITASSSSSLMDVLSSVVVVGDAVMCQCVLYIVGDEEYIVPFMPYLTLCCFKYVGIVPW